MLVVTHAGGQLDAGEVIDRVPGVRGVILLPAGPSAARALQPEPALPDAPLDWAGLPELWRRQALELAVLLLADWPVLGLANLPDRSAGAPAEAGMARW